MYIFVCVCVSHSRCIICPLEWVITCSVGTMCVWLSASSSYPQHPNKCTEAVIGHVMRTCILAH